MKHVKHLYIHIPFCTHICAYCDFVKSRYHEGLADKVVERLIEDIEACESDTLKTCYIGGGTPSALSQTQLEKLCEAIKRKWSHIDEFSVEINPEDFSSAKLTTLQKAGVNRLSVGVQATQPHLLKLMTRHHSFEDVKQVATLAHEAGITNISYDIMYGLPTQTIQALKASIAEVLTLRPAHISLYALTIEPTTAFGRQKVPCVDNELEAVMYQTAIAVLTSAGYIHYEVSSFAQGEALRSQHNQAYWNYEDFIGIGPGAASKVAARRWTNTRNIHHYLLKQKLLSEDIVLSSTDSIVEILMMGLRMNEKVHFARLNQYKNNVSQVLIPLMTSYARKAWLIVDEAGVSSTPLGRMFLHDIIVDVMNVIDV